MAQVYSLARLSFARPQLIAVAFIVTCAVLLTAGCLPEHGLPRSELTTAPSAPCRSVDGASVPLSPGLERRLAGTAMFIEHGEDIAAADADATAATIADVNHFLDGTGLPVAPYLRLRVCGVEADLSVTAFDPVPRLLTGRGAVTPDKTVPPDPPLALTIQRYGQIIFVLGGLRQDDDWARLVSQSFRLTELDVICEELRRGLDALTNPAQIEATAAALAAYEGEREYLTQHLSASPHLRLAEAYQELFADTLAVLFFDDGNALATELAPFGNATAAKKAGFGKAPQAFEQATVAMRDFTKRHTAGQVDALPQALRTPTTILAPTRSHLWKTYLKARHRQAARRLLKALLDASFAEMRRYLDANADDMPSTSAINAGLISALDQATGQANRSSAVAQWAAATPLS